MVTSLQGTVGNENKSKREPQGRLMNPITLYFQSLCELYFFLCISPYGSSQARHHRLHKSRPPGLIQELPLRHPVIKNHFSKPSVSSVCSVVVQLLIDIEGGVWCSLYLWVIGWARRSFSSAKPYNTSKALPYV